MKDLLQASIEEMPGMSFVCSCGREHSVDIEKIVVQNGILDDLVNSLVPYKNKKLFVLSDTNTYGVLGEKIVNRLENEGFRLKSFVFETGVHDLLPNEHTIGRLLLEMEQDTLFALAVGSGVLNDVCRMVCYRMNIPFAIVGTAPSMDGYASVVSPIIINHKKVTVPAKYPSKIFADTAIMQNAPMVMIQAGFGDVLGKLTALADWKLASILRDEYYCGTTASLVQRGVNRCIESAEGLAAREEQAIRYLIEALILTGISMGLVGVSRPASGTEHQVAHFWEVKAIEAGQPHALHGNAVGVGAVVTAMLYELVADMLPAGIEYPTVEQVVGLLRKIGAATTPGELGVSRELFMESMMKAMFQRDKYTILHFCAEKGKLEEFADILTRRFYD